MYNIILGLGHKARQGKNTVADIVKTLLTTSQSELANEFTTAMNARGINVMPYIYSFADALKAEATAFAGQKKFYLWCRIKNSDNFLIYTHVDKGIPQYKMVSGEDVPTLLKYSNDKDINTYYNMEGKDAEFLQIWGNDVRRSHFGDTYWIDRLFTTIENTTLNNLAESFWYKHFINLFIIPDVRFQNEYNRIKELGGLYVNVLRFNDAECLDRFVADDRDPKHISEIDLDEITGDTIISASTTEERYNKTLQFVNTFLANKILL